MKYNTSSLIAIFSTLLNCWIASIWHPGLLIGWIVSIVRIFSWLAGLSPLWHHHRFWFVGQCQVTYISFFDWLEKVMVHDCETLLYDGIIEAILVKISNTLCSQVQHFKKAYKLGTFKNTIKHLYVHMYCTYIVLNMNKLYIFGHTVFCMYWLWKTGFS
jgi:hypothetical protein